MTTVAYITTCKGRLSHLQQTLPLVVAQAPDEVIVVDYACPEGAGQWVRAHYPMVKLVAVDDAPGFNLPRARNLGAAAASAETLCFFDADILIGEGFIGWVRGNAQPESFYRASLVDGVRLKQTWGSTVCSRAAFKTVAGYDQSFRGWGGEDTDFYQRLRLVGYFQASYPASFVGTIDHGDELRLSFYDFQSKRDYLRINRLYRQAKGQLMALQGFNPVVAVDDCLALRRQIEQRYTKWSSNGRQGPLEIAITLTANVGLNRSERLQQSVVIQLQLHAESA